MSSPSSEFTRSVDGGESDSSPPSSVSVEESYSNPNDIAIIGYGCRVPGGNDSPSQLWDFLLNKGDASGEIPEMRWEPWNSRQSGNADILAKTTSKGYFLERLEDFDASFFGISPREAEQIDPQQRIAVEVAWEALEHAGIPPQCLAGSDTAVYMGVNSDDYSRLLLEDLANVEAWMGIGTAFCGIPNRISYLLDLMGPSMAVDAACASSLVAIHLGRQALLAKETSLVIAGGVNALVGPGLTKVLNMAGALSVDGRCRSFDESAAGYGRGEGAGMVVLKRLSDAIEDKDRILAVLKGSAVAADGRTNGIMAPNQDAQERVARQALKEARLSADTISYVEAHATSTPIGDPTECAAMANVYGLGANRPESEPCFIGSLKSNIGHLEAGAGVMGFIKAILAVQNGTIPPQANLTELNSKIDWKKSLLKVVTEPTAWLTDGQPRRAAIASYGYGGTVSHAVIEAAPSAYTPRFEENHFTFHAAVNPVVLLLSAPQASRLGPAAAGLASWLKNPTQSVDDECGLESIAYTLAVKRGHHKFRTAIVAKTKSEAIELLDLFAQGQRNDHIYSGRALAKSESKGSVWVFSGHGAHWKDMGKTLLEDEPAFLGIVRQLEPVIQRHMDFSTITALQTSNFETVDRIQILTYMMQVGLAAVLMSNGVEPRAVVGHSLGELAASVVAGALTVTEGALICCIRSRLYLEVAGAGAMILVNMSFKEAVRQLECNNDIVAAIDSSPTTCVVSGTIEAVRAFSAKWKEAGYTVYQVKSDVAFHGPAMLELADPLRKALEGTLSPKTPRIALYSTSLSDPRAAKLRDVEYWVNNMIRPVLLTSAITAAANDGYKLFLEVSSHPIVVHSIQETLMDAEISDSIIFPTLLRNKSTRRSMLLALGKLHCIGEAICFRKLLKGDWVHNVPGTVWDHHPYWRKVSNPAAGRNRTHDVNAHVLLGRRTRIDGSNSSLWETYLDPQVKPFPGNHPLHGVEIVPAAVLINTFLSAAPGCSLRNVSLRVPVVIDPPREVQVLLENNHMRISSRLAEPGTSDNDGLSWLVNTKTQVQLSRDVLSTETIDIPALKQRMPTQLNESFSIDYLAKAGVSEMGFPWKVLEHMENDNEMLAKVHADSEASPSKHWNGTSWASILDSATSVGSTIFYKEPLLRMPTAIASVTPLPDVPTPETFYIYVKKVSGEYAADILILNEAGNVLITIESMRFAGIEGNPHARENERDLVHRIAWPPAQLSEKPIKFRNVLFISNESQLLHLYRTKLSSAGITHDTVVDPENMGPLKEGSIVIFIAEGAEKARDIYTVSAKSCDAILTTVKNLNKPSSNSKLFCITQGAEKGDNCQALSQAPLLGLARIIQSEEPEIFGGLIDVEDDIFPMQAIKYVQGVDVIRIDDGVARNARLRPFVPEARAKTDVQQPFQLRPQGTYIITGGLGALGLEVATFLAEKGAKRLVLISRRVLSPRSQWAGQKQDPAIQRILSLEAMGVSVSTISVDMATPNASSQLLSALDNLSLPPVLGVIHAAGILANQTIMETTSEAFNTVIAPKIIGVIALHEAFPPKTLDFMVLFSSCGQLLGFPGQASYASGNAFLDTLASHRRALGDNTTSILWTSWRGLGMAASTRYIDAELAARGITNVTSDDAFIAWERIFKHRTDHAVVLRTLPLEADEPLPHPILTDIVKRRVPTTSQAAGPGGETTEPEPTSGPELTAYLTQKITQCVASTLSLGEESIDPHVPLAELGLDSVMTVELRVQLQRTIEVKVGPTLLWNCPTVGHLVGYFVKEKGV